MRRVSFDGSNVQSVLKSTRTSNLLHNNFPILLRWLGKLMMQRAQTCPPILSQLSRPEKFVTPADAGGRFAATTSRFANTAKGERSFAVIQISRAGYHATHVLPVAKTAAETAI